jgi:ribosomal protein S18 acetylase RimI-like enzyme
VPPSQVAVRTADPDDEHDVDALAALWIAARPQQRHVDGAELRATLRNALGRDGLQSFIARSEGRDVGFLVLSRGPLLPLMDEPAVSIEHLYVVDDARRRGIGKALLARATVAADQVGAGQISTSVPASGRDEQRFFARLGFSPFVVRRVASVQALRRRLAPDDRTCVDPTVLRRRSLRARSRAMALRTRSTG